MARDMGLKRKYNTSRQRFYRERNYEITRKAKDVPCADCGNRFPPVCMDFDHVGDDKVDNITTMCKNGRSEQALLAEMAKCEIVCANCHRIRSQQRTDRYKLYNGAQHRNPSSCGALERAAPHP